MRRPRIIRCDYGDAYAGLLAGPGTSWNQVREAMRKTAIVEIAGNTVSAIQETIGGEMIACVEPPLGRQEGYPLLEMEPTDNSDILSGSKPAANLTPRGRVGQWSEAQFIHALRTANRPDGTVIDSTAMPIRMTAQMSDTELQAVYRYLRTLPAKETGGK